MSYVPVNIHRYMRRRGVPQNSYERPHPVDAFLNTKPPIWRLKYAVENSQRCLAALKNHHAHNLKAYRAELKKRKR